MKIIRLFILAAIVALPSVSAADTRHIPAAANWYFHVDLEQMRNGGPGAPIYNWLRNEVLEDIREDAGINVEKELHRLTSYSTTDDHAVLIVDGDFSQETKDIIMAFIASGGDLNPLKASGKTYYHYAGDDDIDENVVYEAGNIGFEMESLGERSWISMDIRDKVIVTATEEHMKELLASNGKVSGSRSVDGALMVLSAEKTLLQAGMRSGAIGSDSWDSNILRNTEQAALLIAAANDRLAIEAKMITTDAEMAKSLASVARGLISLATFDADMDAELASMLRGIKVKNNGNSLSLSLAVDPDLVVRTLND